jgi:light-regulated signal transduction histidine kinase (bacteriophytochrome)
MKFEIWVETIRKEWEKEWREEKANHVATVHNALVDVVAAHKAHVDEIIIALEILLRETLDAKMAQIRAESQIAVERPPTDVKG